MKVGRRRMAASARAQEEVQLSGETAVARLARLNQMPRLWEMTRMQELGPEYVFHPHASGPNSSETALHACARAGNGRLAECLLREFGGPRKEFSRRALAARNPQGDTAVALALRCDEPDAVAPLVVSARTRTAAPPGRRRQHPAPRRRPPLCSAPR